MKILFISYDFPYPPTGGSISRDYNLIKQLSRHHELHWINRTIRGRVRQEYIDEMKKYFKKMHISEWDYSQTAKGMITSFTGSIPYIIKRFESDELKRLVSETISKENFDLILCDHIYLSQYIPEEVIGKIPAIPNNEDCGFTYYKRMSESNGLVRSYYGATQWKKLLNYEIDILKKFKVYITTSENEKDLITRYYDEAEICVIENGVDTEYFKERRREEFSPKIVFTAWFGYYPNVSAAIDFAQNIFPQIQKEIPEIKFYIVGKEPPVKVRNLEKNPGVIVTGFVKDIRPFLQNADAAVVPLKIGGGTRLKILEALSMKVPVVSTRLGAEGLKVEDGRNILIAEDNEDFAKKVIRVIKDKSLAETLSNNGKILINGHYDWKMIGNKMNDFLNDFVKKFRVIHEI